MVECAMFGGLLLDRYFEVDKLPERGQDRCIQSEFECVGGCAVNMAATFNNLGGNAHIVSYVGSDKVGEKILHYLKDNGFSTKYVMPNGGTTGYCMVFLEGDGERTFLTKKGVEVEFSKELVSDELKDIKYVAVTGYFLLDREADHILELLEQFSRRGGYILFDPSPLVVDIDKDILKRILDISNIVTPNVSEGAVLAQSIEPNMPVNCEIGLPQWIKTYINKEKIIVLKNGAAGGNVYKKGESLAYGTVNATATVDTTGAGDSFAAGILYGIAIGLPIELAVTLGGHTAAVTVGINGPHGFWKPNEIIRKLIFME